MKKILALLLLLTLPVLLPAQPAGVAGPYEVIVYDHPNFGGARRRWKLEPWERHKVVRALDNGWDDSISSLRVGAHVGVRFYGRPGLQSRLRDDSYKWVGVGQKDVSNLEKGDDNSFSSLIIFRSEDISGELGVEVSPDWESPILTFLPLPERLDQREVCHNVQDNDPIGRNAGSAAGNLDFDFGKYPVGGRGGHSDYYPQAAAARVVSKTNTGRPIPARPAPALHHRRLKGRRSCPGSPAPGPELSRSR